MVHFECLIAESKQNEKNFCFESTRKERKKTKKTNEEKATLKKEYYKLHLWEWNAL